MTRSPEAIPPDVMVGTVVSATQEVTMPGVRTVTRSRALRAPCWVIVAAAQLASATGLLEALTRWLLPGG